MNWRDELRAKEAATKRWIEERNAELRRRANVLEAKGRQVYADAVRSGQEVLGRNTSELRELGRAAVTGRLPQAVGAVVAKRVLERPAARKSAPSQRSSAVMAPANARPREVARLPRPVEQGLTGFRSTADAISLGYADEASAAADAALGFGEGRSFSERYRTNLDAEHARDRYYSNKYPGTRKAGQGLGFLAGLGVAGVGEVGAAKLVPVLAKASRAINLPGRLPFIRKGYAAMGAAGGGLISAVTQVASDALDGRVSSPTDVLAATGGGIAGGRLAVAGRPVLGAAIGAGGAETLQDLANGGDFSVVDAQHSTNAGAYGGRVFKVAGEHLSNAAPIKTKGAIGDTLTHIKSLARGEYIPFLKTPMGNRSPILPGLIGGKAGSQKAIELPSRAKTVADKVTYWDRALEAKFGPYAKLSKAQREAWDRLGPLFYQPDQWLPKHAGELAAGLVGSAAGQHASDGRQ